MDANMLKSSVLEAGRFPAGAGAGRAFIVTGDEVPSKACRAANSGPEGGPPGAVSGLISACPAPVTPVGRWRACPGLKKRVRTTAYAGVETASDLVPPGHFMRDSCHYRAQNCQYAFLFGASLRPQRSAEFPFEKTTLC